jgi:molybdopterin molybdotransferase
VLAHAHALPPEDVRLEDANGRVLTGDLTALRTQPPADVSAMDGYAVRAADITNAPVGLNVIGEVAAGRPLGTLVGPGEAARIFTGGVIPAGADTVVVQELTSREADRVEVLKPSSKGRHIRAEGLDFRCGDSLFSKGHRLTSRDLALLAGMNHPLVTLHRRPKIALFATGDELVQPGAKPGPGQIVYSNGFALAALARQEDAVVTDLGLVEDTIEATRVAIHRARDIPADILVTTGGASVGEDDFVHKAFTAEGVDLSFWKVAMRPGRPLMHGRLGDMHVLGLPGNPVSCYVGAFLFLIPLIRRLSGRTDTTIPVESAVLGCDLLANGERQDYLQSSLRHGAAAEIATPFPVQDSSTMVSLARADCLVIREPYAPPASTGSRCAIVKFEH